MQAKLGGQMQEAAEAMDFERAAMIRDRLRALTFIQGSQAINADGVGDADIWALACKRGVTCVQAFFIRGGQNWGHRAFFPAHTADVPEDEALASVMLQFYDEVPPPRTILTDRTVSESDLLAEALCERAGGKVTIMQPQRGDRVRLVAQAKRNAEEALDRRAAEGATQARLSTQLAELFGLEGPPQRIEVYDNSHIMGTSSVGAMIVSGPEGFQKGQYRKFNIKRPETIAGDDFGMMREVLERRFARALDEDPDRESGTWPDLLLIDGGKGQVSAVKSVLEAMGVEDVPIVGVAKGPDRNAGRETFHTPDGREISLPMNDPVLFHLQRLRDEAHRFAIGAHRTKRAKALVTSSLDDVPGIGPARKKALLMHFGTARAVKGASLQDLRKAPGVSESVAQTVHDYFHATASPES